MKTTLEYICKFYGWQGGTIHQAHEYFDKASLQERDKICRMLIDNMADISDLRTLQEFTNKRLNNLTIKGIL